MEWNINNISFLMNRLESMILLQSGQPNEFGAHFHHIRWNESNELPNLAFINQFILFLSFQLFNRGHGNLAAATYGTYSISNSDFIVVICVIYSEPHKDYFYAKLNHQISNKPSIPKKISQWQHIVSRIRNVNEQCIHCTFI